MKVSTLILGEHEGGYVKQSSLSAIAAAKNICEENSISSRSVKQSSLSAIAADKFEHPLAEPWAELLGLVQQKGGYSHIIASSSSFGKNILPRAAALLDVSPITDVISGPQLFIRPIYAGNALSTVRYNGANPCCCNT